MKIGRRAVAAAILGVAAAFATASAASQESASRTLKIVVGFGAGGGTDLAARIVAQPLPDPPGGGVTKGGFGKGKGRRRPEPVYSKGDQVIRWMYYLHFGNFAGNKVKALWVALGLLPAMLFITGTIMWWNRVLSPSARRSRKRAAEASGN